MKLQDVIRPKRRYILAALLILAVLAAATWASAAPSGAPAGVNLLVNPGFESPFAKQCCHTEPEFPPGLPIDEVQVAYGWRAWWQPEDAAHPARCDVEGALPNCIVWHRPEWRESAPYQNRIRSGSNSQKYFTFYSVHEAGMMQSVGGIAPGQRLRFSVYMHAWSSHTNDTVSSGQHSMHMRVGIHPTGGTNPWSPSVVWGPAYDYYDQFGLYSVEAVAQNSTVTVFTSSRPVYPLQHNDIYVDDASLEVIGVGSASRFVSAGTPRPTPFRTPTPNASGQIVYTVQRGDYLSLIAVKFGVKLASLKELNGLSYPYRLQPGQKLIIKVVR